MTALFGWMRCPSTVVQTAFVAPSPFGKNGGDPFVPHLSERRLRCEREMHDDAIHRSAVEAAYHHGGTLLTWHDSQSEQPKGFND